MASENLRNQFIQLFSRIRPLNAAELESHAKGHFTSKKTEITVRLNNKSKTFHFNKVFEMESTQEDIYMSIVDPILQDVLQGHKCTIFTFGQTGSGKTYTLIGNTPTKIPYKQDFHGVIPTTLGNLIDLLSNSRQVFTIKVSYMEIYKEVLIDLLSTKDKFLKICEDQRHTSSMHIHGLKEVKISSKDQVYEIIHVGNNRRKSVSNLMNIQPNKSHTVFIITLDIEEISPEGERFVKTGKLNFVELPGSENIPQIKLNEKKVNDYGNINQSVLTLGAVLKGLIGNKDCIPYSDSKLTRVLKDSLVLNAKNITIIATLSPTYNNLQTLNSLNYVFSKKHSTTGLRLSDHLVMDSNELDRSRKDLLDSKLAKYVSNENLSKIVEERVQELERVKEEMKEVYLAIQQDPLDKKLSLNLCMDERKKLETERQIHQELIDKYDHMQTALYQDIRFLSTALTHSASENMELERKVDSLCEVINNNNAVSNFFVSTYNEQNQIILFDANHVSTTLLEDTENLKELVKELEQDNELFTDVGKEKVSKSNEKIINIINHITTEILNEINSKFVGLNQEMEYSRVIAQSLFNITKLKSVRLAKQFTKCWKIVSRTLAEMEHNFEVLKRGNTHILSTLNDGLHHGTLVQALLDTAIEKELNIFKEMATKLFNTSKTIEEKYYNLKKEVNVQYEKIKSNKLLSKNDISDLAAKFNIVDSALDGRNTLQNQSMKVIGLFMDFHKRSCQETSKLNIQNLIYLGNGGQDMLQTSDKIQGIVYNSFQEILANLNELKEMIDDQEEAIQYLNYIQNYQIQKSNIFQKKHDLERNQFTHSLTVLVNELESLLEVNIGMLETTDLNQKDTSTTIINQLESLQTTVKTYINNQPLVENLEEMCEDFKNNLVEIDSNGNTSPIKTVAISPVEVKEQSEQEYEDEDLDVLAVEMSFSQDGSEEENQQE